MSYSATELPAYIAVELLPDTVYSANLSTPGTDRQQSAKPFGFLLGCTQFRSVVGNQNQGRHTTVRPDRLHHRPIPLHRSIWRLRFHLVFFLATGRDHRFQSGAKDQVRIRVYDGISARADDLFAVIAGLDTIDVADDTGGVDD